MTTRADGDASPVAYRPPGGPASGRVPRATAGWTFVRQVHGDRVVVVDAPSGPLLVEADAIATAAASVPVAVLGADCALVALASPQGPVAVAHAGWRGALSGVLERTVEAMRALGAVEVLAVLGPCIHPECYEFGEEELELVAERFGGGVRSVAASGRPALDLPLVVERSLASVGVAPPERRYGCTACGGPWYSHRARGERARHALALWREQAPR